LDVADEGKDLNAFTGRHGILLEYAEAFSGKGSDIYSTTERAFTICDTQNYAEFSYDADGLGAGVRGDATRINAARPEGQRLTVETFRGSGEVVAPEGQIESVDVDADKDKLERLNKDYYANRKAQGWWSLRLRFLRTYRAVTHGQTGYDPESLISISPHIPVLQQLISELSQPTWSQNGAGKLLINKQPDGAKSPNLADSVMILYAPAQQVARGFFDL